MARRQLQVTLHNPTKNIALMAHVQLRRKSGERVLPVFYSDNYVSLVPDETRTITIDAAESDFNGEKPLIVVDGWNVTVFPASFSGVADRTQPRCATGPLARHRIAIRNHRPALSSSGPYLQKSPQPAWLRAFRFNLIPCV